MRFTLLSLLQLIAVISLSLKGFSQSENWKYFRAANTGVCGEEHNFISEDRFGNIWTGGRSVSFYGESSVVRFNHEDTIFTCWSDFEGYLPSEFIYDAEVDSLDLLWVATGEGLVRFDGTNWTTYDMTNTPLPSANIRSVSFDHNGDVWISFQEVNFNIGGVARFDGATWYVYTPSNSDLPHHECYDVLIDSQNLVWIRSQFSVTRFDGLSFTDFDYTNSEIASIQILDVDLDEEDNLYVLCQGPQYTEINVWNGVEWSSMNQTNIEAMQNNYFYEFDIREGKMIFGGSNVLIYDGLQWDLYPSGGFVNDVFVDTDGAFWVASYSSLSKLSETGWKDFERYSSGISEDFNENIFIDSQNRFWAANGNGGIHVFDCPKWQMYGPSNQGLYPSPQDMSWVGSTVCEDSEGNIWFAYNSTSGTVVKIPNGNYQDYDSWEVFDASNSPVSWIEESVADGFGNVFFYSDYGTYMYSNSTGEWTMWDLTNSPLQYYTYGFGVDAEGRAYFGGFQHLIIFDNGLWSDIDLTALGTNISVINDIAFGPDGYMWLATDEGLWKWTGAQWTNWNMANSNIVADHITSVAISADGAVWVSGYTAAGFLVGGIAKQEQSGDWVIYDVNNSGLAAEQIDDIEFDGLGNLWVNTYPRGISVFNENGLVGFECLDFELEGIGGVGITEQSADTNPGLECFPNPFDSRFSLTVHVEAYTNLNLRIIDIAGRNIYSQGNIKANSGLNQIEIDLSNAKSGVYFLEVEKDGSIDYARIVKN